MSNNINEQFRNYSRSADNNKAHVLEKLAGIFLEPGLVLEIGSGSGQHAVYCGNHLPHVVWQPTDQAGYLHDLKCNIDELAPSNVNLPLALDVAQNNWPLSEVDYVYSANTLHILSEAQVTLLIQGVGRVLKNGGFLALYGPFKYGGEFTTDSNARFDLWLKDRDSLSGVRDFETIQQLAADNGMNLQHDFSMPANNQLLVFCKTS